MEEFKNTLTGSNYTLILCHDFPDPDCIASAAGIQLLLKSWKIQSAITYGGFIGRAENRALVQHLDIQAVPINGLDLADFDRVVFVDTQPAAGNHSLPKEIRRDCVIDHHPKKNSEENIPFVDIREDMGATCTIVTQYLRKAKIEISYKLATALYYGIKSDTQDLAREVSAMDREAYHYLLLRVDHKILSQIENPPLDMDLFRTITKAFRNLDIYGTNGWCFLGKIRRPDLVAEIADMFIRINELQWIICIGYLKNILYFSLRTKSLKLEAGDLARELVKEERGSGGGHGQIAAGRIEYPELTNELIIRLKTRYMELLSNLKEPETTPPSQ